MKNSFALCIISMLFTAFQSSCQSHTGNSGANSKDLLIAEAEKYKNEENHDKACGLYAQAYKLDKNDAYLNMRLGFCKLTANERDSALVYYNASIGIKPSPEAYIQRASCYLLLGQYANVLSDADAALAMNPKSVKALTLKAAANFKAGNYAAALDGFKQGVVWNNDPLMPKSERTNTADLYRNIAKTYYDMRQLDSASQYCTLWIGSDSTDYEAYRFRAIIYEAAKKPAEALMDVERTISLQPQHISGYAKAAELYVAVNKHDKACETANKAKASNVKGYEALINAYCKPEK